MQHYPDLDDCCNRSPYKVCGFEGCVEITAKLMLSGTRIVQIPISYVPRKVSEGKKLTMSLDCLGETAATTNAWNTFGALHKT